MNPVPKSKTLITFQLDHIVSDLLHDNSDVPISEHVAEMLFCVCFNNHTCHIQFPGDGEVDTHGHLIIQPRLWSWKHWQTTSERRLKMRLINEKERDKYFIYQANIRIIGKRLVTMLGLEPDQAQNVAAVWLGKGKIKNIRAIGVKKLIEKVEEI